MSQKDLSKTIPYGDLGIIPLESSKAIGKKVDDYIVGWRNEADVDSSIHFTNYKRDSYIIDAVCPRFGSGEAKGILNESVRGKDVYLLVDVCNHSLAYTVCGQVNHMSPDDHFQDLKRMIAAISGKARRITVIMPFLYESRQHKRSSRESLDCALALQELTAIGVDNIITFDAHDPRVQNAIPLKSFETVQPTYQFIKALLKNVRQIIFFYANAVIFNRKDICSLRMYHGNCKHGTIAAIFDGIANDLSQHKLKSSTVCIDCFRLQFVENDKMLLFKKWGIVLQNFTQAVIQIDILKSVILCTALQPGIVQHLRDILLKLTADIIQLCLQGRRDFIVPVIQEHGQQR